MDYKFTSYLLLAIASLLSIGSAHAQGIDKDKLRNQSEGATINTATEAYIPPDEDTVRIQYFTLEDITARTFFQDTTLEDFEKYASFRKFETAALTLGNLGSSHRRVLYQPRKNILTYAGFDQYINYQLEVNDLRYYIVGEAYNDLAFSPLDGRDNFKVSAKFSHNFANDINLSLDLTRRSQEGFYDHQATKSTSFGVGLWKNNKAKNLQTFFSFFANNHNEEHNGGIIAPSFFRVRSQEDSYLEDTDSRHQNFKYVLDNFFAIKKNKYKAHHQILVEDAYYKYGDDDVSTSNDSLVYTVPYLTNERGLRYLMDVFKVRNTFDLSFNSKALGIKLGLMHQYAKFSQDAEVLNANDIVSMADLRLDAGRIANLDIKSQFGLGSNAGNFDLSGLLDVRPFKGLAISGTLKFLRYDPTVIQRSLSISESVVYENVFSKTNEILFGAQLKYDKLNLVLEFNSGLIDKPVAYNSEALFIQKDGTTEYIQAMISHTFRWRALGIENNIAYQQFTDNLFNLPEIYSIHNIYAEFHLFRKKLLTRVGGLYYFTRTTEALEFFPLTGGFIPSASGVPDGILMNEYPYMEVYANFKIKSFRLFVKFENFRDLLNQFDNGYPHYQIVNYPQFDNKLRLGVRWIIRG